MEVDSTNTTTFEGKPLCLIIVGMAGSGKTTFVKSLREHIHENDKPAYTINLDPAVSYLPYEPNIDIRDAIKYKEVMKNYNLGPNGAILTSLNLFATKMNEVVSLIENNSGKTNYVVIDTPGQIEAFKWSASGKIIIETISSSCPTALVYIVDSSRSTNPITFMSNMLLASSMAIEYELPFVLVLNKNDIIDCKYIDDWMCDASQFLSDIESQDLGFMKTTVCQTAYILEEFYTDLKRCGVSSYTGAGFSELLVLLKSAREEFFNVYLKEILPEYLSTKNQTSDDIFINMLDDNDDDEEEEEEEAGDQE